VIITIRNARSRKAHLSHLSGIGAQARCLKDCDQIGSVAGWVSSLANSRPPGGQGPIDRRNQRELSRVAEGFCAGDFLDGWESAIAERHDIAGFDFVEVNPPLDVGTGVTVYLGALTMVEFLGIRCTLEDIASAALFLASEQASWTTGQILSVDGGRL
jgi:hypothetical protein